MIYLILTSNDSNDDSYSWVIMREDKIGNRRSTSENNYENYKNDSNLNSSKEINPKENEEIFKVNENKKHSIEEEVRISEENNSFEEINKMSKDHFKSIIRERSKEKSDIESGNEENKKFISNKFDIVKFNYYKHSYMKNISLKINSYDSFVALLAKGILKVTSKPWELFMDLFVPKSDEGFSLILGFLIPMFFIWNFSELELYILEKVLSRLKVPASFLGFTIMAWGNNAPDM